MLCNIIEPYIVLIVNNLYLSLLNGNILSIFNIISYNFVCTFTYYNNIMVSLVNSFGINVMIIFKLVVIIDE